ncbi:hypothetical protein M0802_005221 [Mischocyttarus mexicanus]|nr:hypothetical protein M0802_005221 [Mischocyttarus mexicanus]
MSADAYDERLDGSSSGSFEQEGREGNQPVTTDKLLSKVESFCFEDIRCRGIRVGGGGEKVVMVVEGEEDDRRRRIIGVPTAAVTATAACN